MSEYNYLTPEQFDISRIKIISINFSNSKSPYKSFISVNYLYPDNIFRELILKSGSIPYDSSNLIQSSKLQDVLIAIDNEIYKHVSKTNPKIVHDKLVYDDINYTYNGPVKKYNSIKSVEQGKPEVEIFKKVKADFKDKNNYYNTLKENNENYKKFFVDIDKYNKAFKCYNMNLLLKIRGLVSDITVRSRLICINCEIIHNNKKIDFAVDNVANTVEVPYSNKIINV